ncbi:MAG: transposase [Chloroflexota bacterium]
MADTTRYHRRSIRLREFEYSAAGAYFVTVCAYTKQRLFGDIMDGEMKLNPFGEILRDEWLRSEAMRPEIKLDAFVIMPNHLHGIVGICRADEVSTWAHSRAPLQRTAKSLGSFVAQFKASATRRINAWRSKPEIRVWQRNYYEHILRNEAELDRARQYIVENPLKWELDRENPSARTIEDEEPWRA